MVSEWKPSLYSNKTQKPFRSLKSGNVTKMEFLCPRSRWFCWFSRLYLDLVYMWKIWQQRSDSWRDQLLLFTEKSTYREVRVQKQQFPIRRPSKSSASGSAARSTHSELHLLGLSIAETPEGEPTALVEKYLILPQELAFPLHSLSIHGVLSSTKLVILSLQFPASRPSDPSWRNRMCSLISVF